MTIEEAKLHWQTAKDDAEHVAYLRDLAFNNYIKVVADDRFTYYYSLYTSIKSYTKADKKTKSMLLFALKSIVGNAKIALGEQVRYGWDEYAQAIKFRYNRVNFELVVPDTNKLNEKNFLHSNEGKIALLYEEKPSYWNTVCLSYDIAEISEAFSHFVNGRINVRKRRT